MEGLSGLVLRVVAALTSGPELMPGPRTPFIVRELIIKVHGSLLSSQDNLSFWRPVSNAGAGSDKWIIGEKLKFPGRMLDQTTAFESGFDFSRTGPHI